MLTRIKSDTIKVAQKAYFQKNSISNIPAAAFISFPRMLNLDILFLLNHMRPPFFATNFLLLQLAGAVSPSCCMVMRANIGLRIDLEMCETRKVDFVLSSCTPTVRQQRAVLGLSARISMDIICKCNMCVARKYQC